MSKGAEESGHHYHSWEPRKKLTQIGTEEEAMIKERVGSLIWLHKRVEAANKEDCQEEQKNGRTSKSTPVLGS